MIHVIIKIERRQAPRELAIAINNDLHMQNGVDAQGRPIYDVTPRPPQLHMLASRVTDPSNLLYAAEWDGRSLWLTVSLGAISDLKMAFMGWPMITQEEWIALNPPRIEP